jgi:drug/metabolite transporter (DMT)-like permease
MSQVFPRSHFVTSTLSGAAWLTIFDRQSRHSRGTAPITTTIFLALASMFGFGAGFVLTQFGLRWMPPWVGVAISIPTSTLLFWCLAPFFVDPSAGSLKAFVMFAGVGLLFPGVAALLNFESNRLMGPNIAGALSSLTPVFAVILAIVILGERVRVPQLLALAALVVGISLMYRVHVTLSARSLWLMALPVASSAIRGVIQPVVKLGFAWWPNPIAAVVVSYTVSSAVLIVAAHARRRNRPRNRPSRRPLVCRGRPLQRTFRAGDVRCACLRSGYDRLTAYRRLPFGDPAAEPRIPGDGRCGSAADRRRCRRRKRCRVATRRVISSGSRAMSGPRVALPFATDVTAICLR